MPNEKSIDEVMFDVRVEYFSEAVKQFPKNEFQCFIKSITARDRIEMRDYFSHFVLEYLHLAQDFPDLVEKSQKFADARNDLLKKVLKYSKHDSSFLIRTNFPVNLVRLAPDMTKEKTIGDFITGLKDFGDYNSANMLLKELDKMDVKVMEYKI